MVITPCQAIASLMYRYKTFSRLASIACPLARQPAAAATRSRRVACDEFAVKVFRDQLIRPLVLLGIRPEMTGQAGDDDEHGRDALRDKAEPEVADRLAGVPFGRLMRLGGPEARRGVAALRSDVVRMDPQEDPRVPGPGQAGQPGHQTLAQALASFAGIDDEPRKLHLCLGIIDPQLTVG